MPTIIFLIFIFVWYFPVYLKQGIEYRLPRKVIPISIVSGMIPGFLAIIIAQLGMAYLLNAIDLPGLSYMAFDSFISAALIEEFIKFYVGYLIIRKADPKRKVDYVLIFGAVGLGFEIAETMLLIDSVFAGVLRGIFALHIIWQFWMGMFYYEYRQSKLAGDKEKARRNVILAFVVPILIHGLNDFLAFVVESKQKAIDINNFDNLASTGSLPPEETSFIIWLIIMLVFMIVEIIFQIMTYKKALRTAKDSRVVL